MIRLSKCVNPLLTDPHAECLRCNGCGRFASKEIPIKERLQKIVELCKQHKGIPLADDILRLAKGKISEEASKCNP